MINRRDFLLSTGVGVIAANRIAHGRSEKFVQLHEPIDDPNVGFGFDSVLGDFKTRIFVPTFRRASFPDSDNKDVFRYEISKSQRDFSRITSVSAKGSGSYGLAKAKASASVKTFFTANSYSCHLIGYFRKPANPYNATGITIDPKVLSFIRGNIKNPLLLERRLGDVVITGFDLAAEIIVVAKFQAESEEKKQQIEAELKASYGNGKGSINFAESVKNVKSSSNTSISVIGNIPDQIQTLTSEPALIELINKFNSAYTSKLTITNYRTRGYNTFSELLKYPLFVSTTNIRLRNMFASRLNSLYQDFQDWSTDIDYVLDNENQFANEVVKVARVDRGTCKDELKAIEALEESSLEAWENSEDWKSSYAPALLDKFRQEFPIYKQKPTQVIIPPKKRRPPRSIPDHHTDRGGIR